MNTPKAFSEQKSSINEKAETGKSPLADPDTLDFASILDDFMDEEVLDKQGATVGTLACYWHSVSGPLVFLGIRVKGHENIRVVPGRRWQVDERNTCIRLGFDAVNIESAPCLDCATELDAALEHRVYEHFRIRDPQPHDGLRHVARPSSGPGRASSLEASHLADAENLPLKNTNEQETRNV